MREAEPERELLRYLPSTYPGNRVPRVYLRDGSSVFEYFGPAFTIVDFTEGGEVGTLVEKEAKAMGGPLTRVWLPGEEHCREMWGRDIVLLRPDSHAGWRAPAASIDDVSVSKIRRVLNVVTGRVTHGAEVEMVEMETVERENEAATCTGLMISGLE